MSATPDDIARALVALAQRHGPDVLGDRRRVLAVLADQLPNTGRDLRILGMAIDNGAVTALKATPPGGIGIEIDRLAARLESHIGTPQALAVPMLRALAHGLDRGALPSVAAPATVEVALPPHPTPPVFAPPPPAVAARIETPPVAPPAARAAGGFGPLLGVLSVYWIIAQAYWLLTSLTAMPDAVPLVFEGVYGYFIFVIAGGLLIAALGVVLAVSFLRRQRSFRVLLTAWLLLSVVVALFAFNNVVGELTLLLDIGFVLDLWMLSLPSVVSLAAAALFLPYAWLSSAVRARFVR